MRDRCFASLGTARPTEPDRENVSRVGRAVPRRRCHSRDTNALPCQKNKVQRVSVTLAAVVALWLLTPVSVFGQAAAAARKAANTIANGTWIPPRTLDGQPDLQGVWLNRSATPLERPRALEGRAFLTDEEVNELRKRADRLFGGNAVNDFAGGDNVFLAALTNPERYIPPNGRSTGGADEMIEREFENRTSLISDPPDGRIPPMTAEGRERSARTPPLAAGPGQRPPAGPEDFSNAMRCITYGVPRLGLNNVNSAGPLGYYQILQAPGYVVLMLEAIHEARIIPLGDRPHLPRSIRQWTGDSRGRWEGNTLVVDTTNFSPRSNFMGSAENLHLIERLTRVAPDTINYEITISDPTTWTKPWTAVIRLKQRHERIYEYACHEGNYMMDSMLAGARAEERAEQAARKEPK